MVHRSPTIELVSPTAQGTPGAATSGSPSLSSDGSLVVFGSTSTDLAAVGADPVVAPFVVSVDRTTRATKVLIGDARRPVVSGDGLHVAYERGTAVRMLSSTSGASFSTSTDRPIDGLDTAGPASRVAMSRFGRWVVFDSGDGTSFTDSVELQEGVMVWAADLRVAADGSIADTTTTTTTTPTTTPPVHDADPRHDLDDHDHRSRNCRPGDSGGDRTATDVTGRPRADVLGLVDVVPAVHVRVTSVAIRPRARWSSSRNR